MDSESTGNWILFFHSFQRKIFHSDLGEIGDNIKNFLMELHRVSPRAIQIGPLLQSLVDLLYSCAHRVTGPIEQLFFCGSFDLILLVWDYDLVWLSRKSLIAQQVLSFR